MYIWFLLYYMYLLLTFESYNSHLMEHKWILRSDSQSLAEESLGKLEVVGQSMFQTNVQEGEVTALH